MSDNKTNDLINDLCSDLSPQKACCPYTRVLVWALFSIAFLLLNFWYFGIRNDIFERLGDASFLFEMILAALLLFSGAMVSSWLSFPDCYQKHNFKAVPVTLFVVFMAWVGVHIYTSDMGLLYTMKLGHCATDGLYIQIIPFIALVYLTIRGNTTEPYWSIFMNIVAISALGWLALRLTCPMDEMGHSFLNHFLPFSIIGAGVGVFARKIFKW